MKRETRWQPIEERWARFINDYERTKHEYRVIFVLAAIPVAHMHLVGLLPSFLYVQVASILDDGCEEIIARDYPGAWPKDKRPTFGNRLDFLEKNGRLAAPPACTALRDRRNQLGHELDAYVDWAELDLAIRVVERELQHLGLVGDRPRFEFTTSMTPPG